MRKHEFSNLARAHTLRGQQAHDHLTLEANLERSGLLVAQPQDAHPVKPRERAPHLIPRHFRGIGDRTHGERAASAPFHIAVRRNQRSNRREHREVSMANLSASNFHHCKHFQPRGLRLGAPP
jgi:hypothetical protein